MGQFWWLYREQRVDKSTNMADAKLMLNTLWGEFTWHHIDTMLWQKLEAPLECCAPVETQEQLDPCIKCSLWRWAITRTGVSLGSIVHGCLG